MSKRKIVGMELNREPDKIINPAKKSPSLSFMDNADRWKVFLSFHGLELSKCHLGWCGQENPSQ